jgi:putative acetyltransferase
MSQLTFEVRPVDPRSPEALELIRELSEELARRYDFADDGSGDFRPEDVLAPRSGFLIGSIDGRAVACGAIRPMEDDVAEIKRMFVVPECRGRGYSRLILAELERLAIDHGYELIRLETGILQPEAIRLYEGAGYRRIPSYGIYVDNALSVCFEKRLPPHGSGN